MLLYHYSKDRYNSLTTREFIGLKQSVEIAKEKLYIGYSNSELERATRQFVSKTRRYFEEDGKKPTLDTVRDKYAAFVPHVMLYPKGVVVEYNEVDKKRIR